MTRSIPVGKLAKEQSMFQQRIQHTCPSGIDKSHTFRVGKRWKVGMKIHFWSMNPRLTGKIDIDPFPFNPPAPLAKHWVHTKTGKKYYFQEERPVHIPALSEALPAVCAIDDFSMRGWPMNQLDDSYMICLGFANQSYTIVYNLLKDEILDLQIGDGNALPISLVANSDGFSRTENFVNWFLSTAKYKPFDIEGQIIHWNGHSYETMYGAVTETDKLF